MDVSVYFLPLDGATATGWKRFAQAGPDTAATRKGVIRNIFIAFSASLVPWALLEGIIKIMLLIYGVIKFRYLAKYNAEPADFYCT